MKAFQLLKGERKNYEKKTKVELLNNIGNQDILAKCINSRLP